MVNKIDRSGKKSRLIFVMSEFDICIIKLDKNKDKNTKKTNPFAYTIFRRIPYQNFQSITFSSMADNYFLIKVLNEPDSLLENRKKTEIIATVKKVSPNTQILFSDVFTVELKKKKRTQFNLQMDQNAPEGGMLKGKTIKVGAGLGKDAYPDIKEPVKVNHTRTVGGYGGGGGNNDNQPPKRMEIPPPSNRGPPGRGPGRLPPRNNPPQDDDGDDGDDSNPPPRRQGPPGRLPPRNNPPQDDGGGSNPPPRRQPGRMPMPGMV